MHLPHMCNVGCEIGSSLPNQEKSQKFDLCTSVITNFCVPARPRVSMIPRLYLVSTASTSPSTSQISVLSTDDALGLAPSDPIQPDQSLSVHC